MNRKELYIAVLITFITIVAWVSFDILHTRSSVEVPEKIQEVIEPINPNFDTQVLESTQ